MDADSTTMGLDYGTGHCQTETTTAAITEARAPLVGAIEALKNIR